MAKAADPIDEVQVAIATLERHGIRVNLRPPGTSERDDVVAWLRANGYDREAGAVERGHA